MGFPGATRRERADWTCPFCCDIIEPGERVYLLVEYQRENTDRRPRDFVCRKCRESIEENQREIAEREKRDKWIRVYPTRLVLLLFPLTLLLALVWEILAWWRGR